MRFKQLMFIFLFVMAQQPLFCLGLHCEVPLSYSDTPHSVGLLWTSDRSCQEHLYLATHTKLTDIYVPRGYSNPQSQQASGCRLMPCFKHYYYYYYCICGCTCTGNSRAYSRWGVTTSCFINLYEICSP